MFQRSLPHTLYRLLALFAVLFMGWPAALPVGATPPAASPSVRGAQATPPTAFASVTAGRIHSCAITTGGGLKCWGDGTQLGDGKRTASPIPVDVLGLNTGISTTVIGNLFSCALKTTGWVQCWGENFRGQLGDNSTYSSDTPVNVSNLSGVSALASFVMASHTCALVAGGGVKCWGDNMSGQLGDGTYFNYRASPVNVIGLSSGVRAIAVGYANSCALLQTGEVKCWGNGVVTPTTVSGLPNNITQLVMGGFHTCILTADGAAKCWGDNSHGQLGNGTNTNSPTPVDVVDLSSGVTALTLGFYHTCAIVNGGAKCWGQNLEGRLGDGSTVERWSPVNVTGLTAGVTALSAGEAHTCAIAGGVVQCWGEATYGRLGNGEVMVHALPRDINLPVGTVSLLALGSVTNCALVAGGAKCWGENRAGQVGDGTALNHRSTPVDVVGLASSVSQLAEGVSHSCALLTNGGVKCWGLNNYGQLGDTTTAGHYTPGDVFGLTSGVSAITSGNYHTCARLTNGSVKCWGGNFNGQLGDTTTTQRNSPTDVVSLTTGVSAIVAGGSHTCAIVAGGVKCWGLNIYGQLGDNSTTQRTAPVAVVGLPQTITAIALGSSHTCALTSSGGVKCWGYNGSGQLGDGTTTQQLTPMDVPGLTSGVLQVVAGGAHTCALLTTGGVKCWGYMPGGVGDGSTQYRTTPTSVSGLTANVVTLFAGSANTCALIANGRVKCWGSDIDGQMGLGRLTAATTPLPLVESMAARLQLGYPTGQTGSWLTLTGEQFAPTATLTVTVNGTPLLLNVTTNATGGFIVFLDTTNGATGAYALGASTALTQTAANFFLLPAAPLRPQEGGGLALILPSGLAAPAWFTYLALTGR